MKKRLGIVGGFGAEASCSLCLEVNNELREKTGCQPDIVMENIAIPVEVDNKMISGVMDESVFDFVLKAVIRLNKAGADFIVIPCNTVHMFIDEFRKASEKPIISIVEESVKKCKNMKKVGVLATTMTMKQKLYENELKKNGIDVVFPEDQKNVTEIILKILDSKANENDKKMLLIEIEKMKQKGAEAVILGCTDLPILVSEKDSILPLIDTTMVLKDAAVKELLVGGKTK